MGVRIIGHPEEFLEITFEILQKLIAGFRNQDLHLTLANNKYAEER